MITFLSKVLLLVQVLALAVMVDGARMRAYKHIHYNELLWWHDQIRTGCYNVYWSGVNDEMSSVTIESGDMYGRMAEVAFYKHGGCDDAEVWAMSARDSCSRHTYGIPNLDTSAAGWSNDKISSFRLKHVSSAYCYPAHYTAESWCGSWCCGNSYGMEYITNRYSCRRELAGADSTLTTNTTDAVMLRNMRGGSDGGFVPPGLEEEGFVPPGLDEEFPYGLNGASPPPFASEEAVSNFKKGLLEEEKQKPEVSADGNTIKFPNGVVLVRVSD